MKSLSHDPLVWTPAEKLAVVLKAISRNQLKLLIALGNDAPLDNPLACSITTPLIWPDATMLNDVFDRAHSDVAAILRSVEFAQWLESRGAGNGREVLARIRLAIDQADKLIDAFRDSGQLDDADEEIERRGRLENHPPALTEAFKTESRRFKGIKLGNSVSVKAATEMLERLGGIATELVDLVPRTTEQSHDDKAIPESGKAEWQFHDHEFKVTFKGVTFPIEGRPLDVLKILAKSTKSLSTKEISDQLECPGESAVRSYISELKKTLLDYFDLAPRQNRESELCEISQRQGVGYRRFRSEALTPKSAATQTATRIQPAKKKLWEKSKNKRRASA